ncbi:MAG: hypothetical protein A3C53_00930 [Omnitrophica WOR_2 bacterium RIFCSPHIGHO2_02_FULL_68_15]|nr:MAG: hypothetical protein A3C53_00930 [Omnitrophica WOR_2 bacterium RIFCSPHIGHO2_02_FULL_68_15]
MPPRNRFVHEWFEKARHDLDAAGRELRADGWPDIVCFHCQQTVEKLLKALLLAQGRDLAKYRWHDLLRLLEACRLDQRSRRTLYPVCQLLTGYYIAARYPLGAEHTLADARRAVTAAQRASRLLSHLLR